MPKVYQYLATSFVVLFSVVCFFAPFSWWTLGILLGLIFPFSMVLLNIQLEIAWILSFFVFCSLACARYPVEVLVGYGLYLVVPLMLLRHQKVFAREIPEELFLTFLSYVLMTTTFFVSLWWQDVITQVPVPLLLKTWPGALGLMAGSGAGLWFLTDPRSLKQVVSVTMFHYWLLILFLVLAGVLEDAHVLFSNMVLSSILPFVLEGWDIIRKIWKNRSKTVFFIAGCCATISGVPLFILALYSIFKPWITTLLNHKE
ncbi:hypothetical protein [Holospora curviuscula]|uniref:Uncharacterized protein n=1 Tax=Holospora curviuscula TaxID=1082868 RepID=A0A2S5R7B4_9PROT|nr:hypothetical protein [Holospora curviuscula]PPE03208.1 hypothetical protein HCUR_01348 [Holospora curviuscula]